MVMQMSAAANEVKIVDKTKTVGDTSITVGVDDTRTVTINGATTRDLQGSRHR